MPTTAARFAADAADTGIVRAGADGHDLVLATLSLNTPDLSHYARTQRDQVTGQALGRSPRILRSVNWPFRGTCEIFTSTRQTSVFTLTVIASSHKTSPITGWTVVLKTREQGLREVPAFTKSSPDDGGSKPARLPNSSFAGPVPTTSGADF